MPEEINKMYCTLRQSSALQLRQNAADRPIHADNNKILANDDAEHAI